MKIIENSECLAGFGKFIRDARERQGLFQADVAGQLGITQSYYSVIERGSKDRNVDLVLALEICKVLKIDLNDFIKQYM